MYYQRQHFASKVPRGNGTLCRVTGIKLKHNAQSSRWKNYYNRKVNTVIASDVEWMELEHYPKPNEISTVENKIEALKQKKLKATVQQL